MSINEYARTVSNDSEAAAIIAAVENVDPIRIVVEGIDDGTDPKHKRQWMVHKDGWKLQEITDPSEQPAPTYLNQSVMLNTPESLIDYVNRFKTSATMLFANLDSNSITAILDYHYPSHDGAPLGAVVADPAIPSAPTPEVPARANRAFHQATLELVTSEEWDAWTGIDGELLPQLDFARFIEENMGDIVTPDGATVLELVRTLQVTKNYTWKGSVRTDSNHQDLNYQETSSSGAGRDGSMPMPVWIDLSMQVFLGGFDQPVRAFVRHEASDGKLRIGVKLKGVRKIRQRAFDDIAQNVRDATDVPFVVGATD